MTVLDTTTTPLLDAVATARAAITSVATAQPLYLTTPDKEALLAGLGRLEAQVAELRLRTMADAGDIAAVHGTRDVAAWLARTTRTEPARLRADSRLATALTHRYPATATALADARVSLDQARAIATSLDDLPDHLDPDLLTRAEHDLLRLAADFGPADLRRLGRAILHTSCPDIADDEDRRRLEAQEAHAHHHTSLRLRPTGDGTTRISLVVPDLDAARLATYLDAWTNPAATRVRDRAGQDTDQDTDLEKGVNPDAARLPRHRRLGHAFCALLEHLDPHTLPHHGGDATTLVVTLTADQLRTGLGAATVTDPRDDTGRSDLSITQARRLACTAGILPAVLGTRGEVLDLGRRKRLFPRAIHRALRIQHPTCTAHGCTIPARWCDAHHLTPWSHGGPTDLTNATLLCSHHHHRIHDPTYQHTRHPDGTIDFHRRT